MKRIAIYARVSTHDKQNYQRQINDLTPIIVKDGYNENDIEIFGENISGYKKKEERPEFNRLLNIIKNDPSYFSCIYCTEISRLGRNPKEARETVDLLIELGIPLYVKTINQKTINDDGSRNGIMSIILQVLMEFAHMEAEQMKDRSKSGLLTSAKAGKSGGAKHQPYGYTKDDNKMLIIDVEEAEIIKKIFSLYQQGNGVKIIASILNSQNILTKYNKMYAGQNIIHKTFEKNADKIKWQDKTVLDIISNPLYKGHRRYKGQILKAPAIISEELFDICNEIRKTKTHRNNLTAYTYLFKDKMSCGCCGRNYYGRYKPTEKGDKVYICSSALIKGARCENKGLNISLIETAIFDQLIQTDRVLKYLSNSDDLKHQLEQDIAVFENMLTGEKANLKTKEKEKERLLDLYLSSGDAMKDVFFKKDAHLTTQLTNISKKIDRLKKDIKQKKQLLFKQSTTGATKQMLENAAFNRTELKAIFDQIIHKVIINDLTVNKTLATVYLNINGIVILNTLKVVIDKMSIRKKILKYIPIGKMENEPVYKDEILLVGKEDILEEIDYHINEKGWLTVQELLKVEPKIKEAGV